MPITLFNTWTLIQVQQRFPDLPDGFWRKFFTREVTSASEEIMFDAIDTPERKLAPFVAPNVQGRVFRGQGFLTRSFKPAYVKPKHIMEPSKALRRMFGETLGGSVSPESRYRAKVGEYLRIEREMIERRWDWMAAQAIIYGEVTIDGQDYPTQTIDFGRNAALDITLTGTARWDQFATADPLADLQSAESAAFRYGNAPITDFVFGNDAWAAFIKNEDVLDLLDNTRRGSTAEFSRTGLNQSGNYQPMGEISSAQGGSFRLWRYNNWYHEVNEETGELTVRDFLDVRDVVGIGQAIDGVAAFGAIQDVRALEAGGLVETRMYPKQWIEEDPSTMNIMTQSAPLFVPTNPNNTFRIRVKS